VIVAFALWQFWGVSAWFMAMAGIMGLVIGAAIFPYTTRFELKDEHKIRDPQSGRRDD
jgi:hypothetical protein